MSFDLFRGVLITQPKSHSRVTDKGPIHFLGTTDDDGEDQFGVVDAIAGEIPQRSHPKKGRG
jgi:hypothetical protein